MSTHEHVFIRRPEVSTRYQNRYRCECGQWGRRTTYDIQHGRPITLYAARSEDAQRIERRFQGIVNPQPMVASSDDRDGYGRVLPKDVQS